jgi:hypothetical protein
MAKKQSSQGGEAPQAETSTAPEVVISADEGVRAPVQTVKPGVRRVTLEQARAMHAAKHL